MPAYRYQDYINPLVGRIADSLGSSNDAKARGIYNAGQATARGQELSGLAWGRAASDIANTGAGAIQEVQQVNAQKKQQQSVQALLKQTPRVDLGGGVMGYDIPTITDAMMQSGADPKPIVDRLGPVNQSLQQMHTARMAAVKTTAQAVHDAGNDPDLALSAIDTFEQNGVVTPQQAAQFRQMATTPEGVAKMTSYFIGPPKTSNAAPGSMLRDESGALVPGSQVPTATTAPRPIEHDPTKDLVSPDGTVIKAGVPKPTPEQKQYEVTVPGPGGKPLKKLVDEATLKAGVASYEKPPEPKDKSASDNIRLDKSYQFNSTQLEKERTPIAKKVTDVNDALTLLNQATPASDALVAPKILSVTAGGVGSGLRMNEAEISRILGGKNQWQSLKSKIDAWQLDPSKPFAITPEQRQQMREILQAAQSKAQQKLSLLDTAGQDLVDAQDIASHRNILSKVKRDLDTLDQGATKAGASAKDPLGIR